MYARKLGAEAIGTFWLTFAGCGSAVVAAAFPQTGIGFLGVSLAFGLTVLTMAYSIGHISGCHLNPAVTLGLAAGGRFPGRDIAPYVGSQLVGAIIAAAALYVIARGAPGFDVTKGFAANGFGEHSPGKYSLFACFLAEVVLTMMFLFIIMGATHGKAPAGFAPLAIGFGLTLAHLVGIPITNTSVNPARSTGARCSTTATYASSIPSNKTVASTRGSLSFRPTQYTKNASAPTCSPATTST